jgi:hypothetical protein
MRYIHPTPEHKLEALKKLERFGLYETRENVYVPLAL